MTLTDRSQGALHYAAEKGFADVVQVLMKAGASAEVPIS